MSTDPAPSTSAAGSGVRAHTGGRLRIALSCNLLHADPDRMFYPPSVLCYVEEQMAGWVSSTGALTYPIPTAVPQGGVTLADYVADLDGLVVTGGADVCPRTYGQEPMRPAWQGDDVRDRYEIELIERFLAAGKPVLGICRGEQVLNVAFGGTLYQDILTQCDTELEHRSQVRYHRNLHEIDLAPDGWLASVYPGVARATVNSIHHQAVCDLGRNVVVEARSATDGIVEAIRVDDADLWARAVQWHPEFHALVPDVELLATRPLLDSFLVACAADDDRPRRTRRT